ncbi:hypothetical protein EB796_007647 [Bugula neritina]|uniref:Uncharacterized protein n=1 Tax=Bugula neritina TaxID=10212 RepID=A0A7J7K764_BUGNE|nr:hypothetical protein EB796_007647 [Bugula neritina]
MYNRNSITTAVPHNLTKHKAQWLKDYHICEHVVIISCDGDNKSYLSSIDLYFRVFKRVSNRVVQPELISLTNASPVIPLCLSHFLHLSSKPTIISLINIQVP